MNKREKQKEETLLDILRVSEELFHEQGYEKTTIQNIAERCGLSKGALYHHFKSKEEVLERICYLQYLSFRDIFTPVVSDANTSMLEKLKKIMTIARSSLINTASAEYSGGKTSETGGIENAAMEKLLDKYSKKIYLDIFAPLFRQGKENGECNFPVSAEVMAVFIHHLDTGMSEQLNMILHDEEKEDAGERIGEVIKGFSYAVSRLLNIDEKTVEEVTLTDIMLDQYLRILEKRNKKRDL